MGGRGRIGLIPLLRQLRGDRLGTAASLSTRIRETLVGFLRDGDFNVYAGRERIAVSPS